MERPLRRGGRGARLSGSSSRPWPRRTKGAHRLWADDVSVVDDPCGVFAATVGHRQVTDAHLLTLAIRPGGALATFDRGIAALATDHPQHVAQIAS